MKAHKNKERREKNLLRDINTMTEQLPDTVSTLITGHILALSRLAAQINTEKEGCRGAAHMELRRNFFRAVRVAYDAEVENIHDMGGIH